MTQQTSNAGYCKLDLELRVPDGPFVLGLVLFRAIVTSLSQEEFGFWA